VQIEESVGVNVTDNPDDDDGATGIAESPYVAPDEAGFANVMVCGALANVTVVAAESTGS
jgi:hypothetical protein